MQVVNFLLPGSSHSKKFHFRQGFPRVHDVHFSKAQVDFQNIQLLDLLLTPKRHCPCFFCFLPTKTNRRETNVQKSPKECPKSTSFFTFCTSDLMSNHDASSLPKPNAVSSRVIRLCRMTVDDHSQPQKNNLNHSILPWRTARFPVVVPFFAE